MEIEQHTLTCVRTSEYRYSHATKDSRSNNQREIPSEISANPSVGCTPGPLSDTWSRTGYKKVHACADHQQNRTCYSGLRHHTTVCASRCTPRDENFRGRRYYFQCDDIRINCEAFIIQSNQGWKSYAMKIHKHTRIHPLVLEQLLNPTFV